MFLIGFNFCNLLAVSDAALSLSVNVHENAGAFPVAPSLFHSTLIAIFHFSSISPAYLHFHLFLPLCPDISQSLLCEYSSPWCLLPWYFEERFDRVHLRQWWVSVCQLYGSDAQRPHITAGIIRVVILLFTCYHLHTEASHTNHDVHSVNGK